MERLFQLSNEKIARIDISRVRRFISQVDWSQQMVGIRGARGIGKTTLLLQYLRLNYGVGEKSLYISADNLYFSENRLYDLASIFSKKGGRLLVIDEVHRYPNWAIEMKNMYDDLPDLKVIYTGSSLLELHKAKADLSRRALTYDMPGLSFREFLEFELNTSFDPLPLSDMINDHVGIAAEIISQIKPLEFFDNYLRYGYYPFYLEGLSSFDQKLLETVHLVLEVDIPQFMNMQIGHIQMLKRLLQVISTFAPFQPNLTSLSERTGISLNTLKSYLYYLHQAAQISLLQKPYKGVNSLNKPAKIYLNNTNLMHVLGNEMTNKGSARETFFQNQIKSAESVFSSKHADFQTATGITFEVAGANKNHRQIKGLSNAYLVKDQIEIGSGNSIPLWLFGFLY
ncbi:MAG: AAA family ATPase [candidate division Zixibacteria bacterium]|nr:AAA family ATPase [candidate division Zixibacteria bacterium]